MEETTDMFSSAPEGELRPLNGSYGERDFEKYKRNFFMYVWHRISLLEKIVYVEGNALKCLICVGETAVAEIFSDIKGLEEVRETPIKRQREGVLIIGRTTHVQAWGVGDICVFSSVLL